MNASGAIPTNRMGPVRAVLTKYVMIEAGAFALFLALLFPFQLGRFWGRTPTPAVFLFLGAIALVASLHGLSVLYRTGRSSNFALFTGLFVVALGGSFLPLWFGRPWVEGHAFWSAVRHEGFILDGPVYARWEAWAYLPPLAMFAAWVLIRWQKRLAPVAAIIALVAAFFEIGCLVAELRWDYDSFYGPSQIRLIGFAVLAPFLFIAFLYFRSGARTDPIRRISMWGLLFAGYAGSLLFAPGAIEREERDAADRAEGYYVARQMEMTVKELKAGIRIPPEQKWSPDDPLEVEVTRRRCYLPFVVSVTINRRNGERDYGDYQATYFWLPFGVVRLYKSNPF
jgi:hypothetical protein